MIQPGRTPTLSIAILCSLGLFLAGYIFYTSAFIEPFYSIDFALTPWQIGLAQSGVPFGAIVGAMLAGWLADHVGRRRLLVYSFLLLTITGLISGFVFNYTSLFIIRFINGCLAGTLYPLCAAYLTEMTPSISLARQSAILMFMNCLAAPIGCLMAFLLFHFLALDIGWRVLSLCQMVPAFFAYQLAKCLPESSAWLQTERREIAKTDRLKNIRTLFHSQYRTTTFCLMGTWFLMDIAYYGVNFFIPYLLQSMQIQTTSAPFEATLVISLFFALGALAAVFIIEKMNIITLQKYGFLLASISLLLLANYFYFDMHQTYLIILLFVIFNFALNAGPDVTTYLLSATSYPVEIRGTGHGWVAGFAKIGSVIGVLFLPKLQQTWGHQFVVMILCLLLFAAYLLTHMFGKIIVRDRIIREAKIRYETH